MKRLLAALAFLALALPAYAAGPNSSCYTTDGTNCVPVSPTTPFPVTPLASASGGSTAYHLVAAASNNSTSLKGSAGTVYSIQLAGIGSSPAYLKLYNKASAPTCGTDVPVGQYIIPAASTAANGGGSNISFPAGLSFSAGIGLCVVTGIADSDNTSVAASTFVININYK